MLKVVEASADSPIVAPLWFPGKPNPVYPLTLRSEEIAKSRQELLSLLHDLPESDYELSFKDLVERGQDGSKESSGCKIQCPRNSGISSWASRREMQGSNRILLNVFVPVSLSRSRRRSRSSSSVTNRSLDLDDQRFSESTSQGCWSILCRQKSRRKARTDGSSV